MKLGRKTGRALASFLGFRRVKGCVALSPSERKAGWRLYFVDLRTNGNTKNRRVCVASKQPIRWAVVAATRDDKFRKMVDVDWFATKEDAKRSLRTVKADDYYKRGDVKKAKLSKKGDARTKSMTVVAGS